MENDKIVYFGKYCKLCKHCTKKESEDPCWDCLTEPVNQNSHKPLCFEEDPKRRYKNDR